MVLLLPTVIWFKQKGQKRKCGWKAKHCGWVRSGRYVPARSEEMPLSPFLGFSIALSLLIRKLMQLSVLILESSFYSFFFCLCNLFLFCSALICAVAADDKTGCIRLLPAFSLLALSRLEPYIYLIQQLCWIWWGKKKNFSRWRFLPKLEVFWWYCPLKLGRMNGCLCFKHKVALVLGPLKCTKCWGLRRYCSWGERMNPRVNLKL